MFFVGSEFGSGAGEPACHRDSSAVVGTSRDALGDGHPNTDRDADTIAERPAG